MPPLVFCSGSCRLLTSVADGRGRIRPLHSMFHNFIGCNCLTKLHTTRQHIQFFKWIKGDLDIPAEHMPFFLSAHSGEWASDMRQDPVKALANIRAEFDKVDVFLIEVCSIKNYEMDGIYHQHEMIKACDLASRIITVSTEQEVCDDLAWLKAYLGKPVIAISHFRPHVWGGGPCIENRELIVRALVRSGMDMVLDPSSVIRDHAAGARGLLSDETHFSPQGHAVWGEVLCDAVARLMNASGGV